MISVFFEIVRVDFLDPIYVASSYTNVIVNHELHELFAVD